MKEKYVGYVINSIDYKDNDSILSVLCKDGIVSLRARGVKKINSKNASSVMSYAYSEFEVSKSSKNGYLTLNEGKLIKYPSFISSNLEYISLINFISEGIELVNREDSFECFVDCLDLMKDNYNSEIILVAFLNYFLSKHGCSLNVDECVSCGNKNNIIKFSFDNGGYLCRNCCNYVSDDIEYLKNIRVLAKVSCKNVCKVNIDVLYCYKYIKEVISLIENKIGVYFKSKKFLFKILKGEF